MEGTGRSRGSRGGRAAKGAVRQRGQRGRGKGKEQREQREQRGRGAKGVERQRCSDRERSSGFVRLKKEPESLWGRFMGCYKDSQLPDD